MAAHWVAVECQLSLRPIMNNSEDFQNSRTGYCLTTLKFKRSFGVLGHRMPVLVLDTPIFIAAIYIADSLNINPVFSLKWLGIQCITFSLLTFIQRNARLNSKLQVNVVMAQRSRGRKETLGGKKATKLILFCYNWLCLIATVN